MKKKSNLIFSIIIIAIILLGTSYAFFIYDRTGSEKSEVITGNIYMKYNGVNSLFIDKVFPQTKEEGLSNDYFEFSVTGKNESNKDLYYAINLIYGDEKENKKRFHDEDIVFYLTEVIDGEEKVLIDSVQYKNINNSKIWVENVSANTDNNIKHTYRLRAWISDSVVISDTLESADYTSGEYGNSYATIKINVVGNLKENDINMILTANDDNIINGRRAIDVDTYGYANDNLVLEVTSDNKNVKFMYTDEIGNSSEELNDSLTLNYNTLRKDVIATRVILVPENDANTKANIYFKLIRNGEIVEEQVKSVLVYGNNYCLNNGFNKLYDCILVSEKMSNSVSTAKNAIEAKGEPNLNDTAPSYTYIEDVAYDINNVYTSLSSDFFYFSDSYKFNSTTGIFSLYNSDGSDIITNYLSEEYKNYYTCGGVNMSYTRCDVIYRIKVTSVSGQYPTITKGDILTSKVASSIKSEVGLYKSEDDYGDAYFYRGDVNNNNVLFGGYYWKIIRTNGDNSIRLIYSGLSSNSKEHYTFINDSNYTYSNKYSFDTEGRNTDPAYVGYMYGKNFAFQTSSVVYHVVDNFTTKFYFGDSYEFDEETEKFKLKKDILEPILKTFEEMGSVDETTGKKLYEIYPYTCKSTSVDGLCEVLIKVDSVTSSNYEVVQYISYSSTSRDGTKTNEVSSNAKIEIEKWYESNIINKKDSSGNLITDYITDGTYCNDRSITNASSTSVYSLGRSFVYDGYTRLYNNNATLKCDNDIRDKFSSTTGKGNGLLKYPVALITADEYVLAGGKVNEKNANFYLSVSSYYWTMTPLDFASSYPLARMFTVGHDGGLQAWANVGYSFGLRPVINLRSDVLISQGDGTIENPYQLKLA